MKVLIFACFALFAVASAHTINRDLNRNIITDIIWGIFNANKHKLANISIAEVATNHGKVTNINVLGANNTNIDKMEANGPLSMDVDFSVSCPEVSYSAYWALAGLRVDAIGLEIDGEGVLTGTASNIVVRVGVSFGLTGLTPKVKDYNNFHLDVPTINANLAGNVNQAENDKIINEKLGAWLSEMAGPYSEEHKDEIILHINEILAGLV